MDIVTSSAATGGERDPVRLVRTQERPHWHAALAVVAAVLLYIALPERLTVGPNWLLPIFEAALLPPLLFTTDLRRRHGPWWHRLLIFALSDQSPFQRTASFALIGVVNAANVGSLVLLSSDVLNGTMTSGTELVFSAASIWLTNVIVFGLWYWQLDRGGPGGRVTHPHRPPDFLFPQEVTREAAPRHWRPGYIDYLYVAYTNATAFSPTDTVPLTGWAKILMAIQALASLVTAVLVLARAVNTLT